MKKFSLLALAAVGLLFGACSDSNVDEQSMNDAFKGKSEGYFKVNINLPTTPSTRAWQEDAAGTLDDGTATGNYEYAVDDAILLVFDGASESAAKLKEIVTLTTSWNDVPDDPNHITTNSEAIAKLTEAPSENLYALVAINSITSKAIYGTGVAGEVKIGGTTLTKPTIAEIQAEVYALSATNNFVYTNSDSKKRIFMTNAVLSTVQGGIADPGSSPTMQILAPIKAEYIYETQTDAAAGTAAADIYVERGVAKVTVDASALAVNASVKTSGGAAVTFDDFQWTLDNVNTQSFAVRQVPSTFTWNWRSLSPTVQGASDSYRFIGGYPVDGYYGGNTLYRTYWAEDPNYDDGVVTYLAPYTTYHGFQSGTGVANPQYCLENTFDVAHQERMHTTRALISVELNGGTTFYTMGAARKTLYTFAEIENAAKKAFIENPDVVTWFTTPGNGTGTLTATDVKLTWNKPAVTQAGVLEVTKITIDKAKIAGGTDQDFNNTAPVANILDYVNSQLVGVERFVDGVTYYQIRIKHFGEDLTIWNKDEYKTGYAPAESTIATIYPDADDHRQNPNYLGRYGMVRNNWYDLVLGEIIKIGSSEVPDITTDTHPDDDIEDLYIKARINILAWAKRTQNWNLK
jgi:hypothetical protein